jgi:hypothetical protein
MFKLSQQAIVVTIAAMLPIVVAVYKHRMLDSFVLSIVGAITIYNVDCLTKGNCNTWATLVSITFFIMTFMQLLTSYEPYTKIEESDKGWIIGVFPDINKVKTLSLKTNLEQRLSAINEDAIQARNEAKNELSKIHANDINIKNLGNITFDTGSFSITSGTGGQSGDGIEGNNDVSQDKKTIAIRVCTEVE